MYRMRDIRLTLRRIGDDVEALLRWGRDPTFERLEAEDGSEVEWRRFDWPRLVPVTENVTTEEDKEDQLVTLGENFWGALHADHQRLLEQLWRKWQPPSDPVALSGRFILDIAPHTEGWEAPAGLDRMGFETLFKPPNGPVFFLQPHSWRPVLLAAPSQADPVDHCGFRILLLVGSLHDDDPAHAQALDSGALALIHTLSHWLPQQGVQLAVGAPQHWIDRHLGASTSRGSSVLHPAVAVEGYGDRRDVEDLLRYGTLDRPGSRDGTPEAQTRQPIHVLVTFGHSRRKAAANTGEAETLENWEQNDTSLATPGLEFPIAGDAVVTGAELSTLLESHRSTLQVAFAINCASSQFASFLLDCAPHVVTFSTKVTAGEAARAAGVLITSLIEERAGASINWAVHCARDALQPSDKAWLTHRTRTLDDVPLCGAKAQALRLPTGVKLLIQEGQGLHAAIRRTQDLTHALALYRIWRQQVLGWMQAHPTETRPLLTQFGPVERSLGIPPSLAGLERDVQAKFVELELWRQNQSIDIR